MAKIHSRTLSGTSNSKVRIYKTVAGQTGSDVLTSPGMAYPVCGAMAVEEKCKLELLRILELERG
jgi:hypothetical protein